MRERIAESHGFAVVDGTIRIPDLRLEYETAESDRKHVDLELVTRFYGAGTLADKARAGLTLFARVEDAARVHRALARRAPDARFGVL